MNTEIKKTMKELAERFRGQINGTDEFVDFDDGTCISIYDLQKEYERYEALEEEIEEYIEKNDLDDVIDHKKIMEHFNLDYYYWFTSDQARLASFSKIIICKYEGGDLK